MLPQLTAFARFLAMLLTTFLGLLVVTFIIGRLMPIDPVLAVIGKSDSQAQYDRVFAELGLDQPLYIQFWRYISGIVQGDFGNSLVTANPVIEDIQNYFPATFELATIAIILGVGIGVPLGVISAIKQNKLFDYVNRFFGLIGYSAPIFWLGYIGIIVFYKHLDWVAAPEGRLSIMYEYSLPKVTNMVLIDAILAKDWGAFKDAMLHIILPASLLGYYSIAYISRMTRAFMIEQLNQEYITAARIKGVSEWRVITHHALRNAVIPLITVIALSYASLLEGSVLTEMVFAWPGIGRYVTDSLLAGDMNAVLGGTIVIGMVFIFLNLLSDFLYKLADPRAK